MTGSPLRGDTLPQKTELGGGDPRKELLAPAAVKPRVAATSFPSQHWAFPSLAVVFAGNTDTWAPLQPSGIRTDGVGLLYPACGEAFQSLVGAGAELLGPLAKK